MDLLPTFWFNVFFAVFNFAVYKYTNLRLSLICSILSAIMSIALLIIILQG